jgi:hypothetical protein
MTSKKMDGVTGFHGSLGNLQKMDVASRKLVRIDAIGKKMNRAQFFGQRGLIRMFLIHN